MALLDIQQTRLHAKIEDEHWWFVGRREIVRSIVDQVLPAPERGLVVDVGCGTGGNLAALVHDYRCVGIDPSEEAIRLARERFPGIDFLSGHAPADLGPLNGEADMLLLLDVLEHVRDDRELLADLVGEMRPGACLLITVPADMSLWGPHDTAYGHFRRYEGKQLRSTWDGLRVKVRLFSYFNTTLYPLVKGVRLLTRFRRSAWGEAGTDLRIPSPYTNALLRWLFSREARALCAVLTGDRETAFSYGVSIIVLLERR